MLYNKFSDYLQKKYDAKVFKLPVNLPVTCPNRDGRLSASGCVFCGEEGAGFENLSNTISVKEQLSRNAEFFKQKYKAEKFIAYFQNFSNTYLPFDDFERFIIEASTENVCAIYISTRPDCINDRYLAFLKQIKLDRQIDIVIELGLQTVNYHTLKKMNRGHSLAEYIDAVSSINAFGLESCAHYIIDYPADTIDDIIEGAKIISALKVQQVKCHSLYILKDTRLGEMYQNGEITPLAMEDFIERCIAFLEYLNPEIVVQRLIGRAPEERSLFCSWNTSWWKIRDRIEEIMLGEGRAQGSKFNYLNGAKCVEDEKCGKDN